MEMIKYLIVGAIALLCMYVTVNNDMRIGDISIKEAWERRKKNGLFITVLFIVTSALSSIMLVLAFLGAAFVLGAVMCEAVASCIQS
jgi:membrane-anchored glycerophosphoryl diester phosphodiesterase (GDPDase)